MNRVKILLFSLFCLLTLTSKADLILHKPKHAEIIKAAYASFPERGKNVTVDTYEYDDVAWSKDKQLRQNTNIVGMMFYSPFLAFPEVYLRELPDPENTRQVFAHEYGHVMYFNVLSPKEQSTWDAWWAKNLNEQPRWYGKTDAKEGFAEAFMATYTKDAVYDPSWGFALGYKPSLALTTKVRSFFRQ